MECTFLNVNVVVEEYQNLIASLAGPSFKIRIFLGLGVGQELFDLQTQISWWFLTHAANDHILPLQIIKESIATSQIIEATLTEICPLVKV